MKWNPVQLKQTLEKSADQLPPLLLVYGDDSGRVRQLAKAAAQSVCPHDDPFMMDRLAAADIQQTPSALQECAQTMGFGGGRKLVQVDANHMDAHHQKSMTEAVKGYLSDIENNPDVAGAVVVIAAAGLDAKAALAKAAEKSRQAAAIRCFEDSSRDLNQVVSEKLQATGQKITPEARNFLLDALGKDRGVTDSELDKLMLYTINKDHITLDDCLAVIASAPSINIFKLCDAIGLRDRKQTDSLLKQLQHEGMDSNMMLAMVSRHLRRIKTCQDMMKDSGLQPRQAMAKLRPPVFMGQDLFETQLNRTPYTRVKQSLNRLYTLQSESRSGVSDGELTIHRGLLALSA